MDNRENNDKWNIKGYEFSENDLIEILKKSVEENSSYFYFISINKLKEYLLKIIDGEKEIMFFPIGENVDIIIKSLNDIKIINVEEIKKDPDIKEKIKNIKIGITGADAIAAETGSIIFADDSYTKSYVAFLPEKHIVIAKKELIFSNILLALKFVIDKYKNNVPNIQIIQGPSKTGDIEKKIIRPSHGPKELHLIIIE